MNKYLLTGLLFCMGSLTAWACHTPTQAAKLNKQYPDWDFVGMMHKAHSQPYEGYKFSTPHTCDNGMADIFECSNIDLLGHLDLSQIGGGQGSDSWGWKHAASNRYFALVGRSNGTSFVEITDPSQPKYLGELPSTAGFSSAWRDIKTYQNHAYIVADDIVHGMQVFNLTRLLDVTDTPTTFSADHLYTSDNLQSAHNITINETTGFAYLLGSNTCEGGLHMVNIQNPVAPEFVGCFAADGYTHDAQCVIYQGPDGDYQGREMCFASNEDTITTIDVTDKADPKLISKASYTGRQYTHQGWLSADQKYFIVDDEMDEIARGQGTPDFTRTYVIDMSDLDAPVYVGHHNADGASVDHNQYIVDGHTYQANYTRGLRVLKLGDLSQAEMTEVAFFDTYPTTSEPSVFGGAWNVYPFFDNGMVMVSDVNRGVFLVKPQLLQETNIEPYHSGLWYNPEQNGHGLNISVLDNNRISVNWFTYDKEGKQMWLVGTGSYQGNEAVVDVIVTVNGVFPPLFVAADVEATEWGQFNIRFDGCDAINFTWQPGAGVDFPAGSMEMIRLAQPAGLSCQQ